MGSNFQLYHLVPVLTAYENVELPWLIAALGRRERRERVEASWELKQGLKGGKGLKETSKVAVVGTVDKASSAGALIVNARQLVVEP